MAAATPEQLDKLLLGGRSPRFIQDSPIMPDVWSFFARDPDALGDLLLTVHERGNGATIAAELRDTLAARRQGGGRPPPSVAPLSGLIAAKIYLDELFSVVLPMTTWWTDLPKPPEIVSGALIAEVERLRAGREPGPIDTAISISTELAWMASVAGALLAPRDHGEEDGAWPPSAAASVSAFLESGPLGPGDRAMAQQREPERTLWRIAYNRSTRPATTKSVLAIKADAALAVFHISCRDLTWAVLDCGIDASHPAFQENGVSRVTHTYDFTRVRDLLDPAKLNRAAAHLDSSQAGAAADGEDREFAEHLRRRIFAYLQVRGAQTAAAPSDGEIARFMRETSERLRRGLEVDIGMLEPFLEIIDPSPPELSHGTHVAGILGGAWREPDGRPKVVGVCPDIRMIDMRVLDDTDPEGRGTEFAIIAALQFIRHLNARSNKRMVHGANLSLYTRHDVRHAACGATPICEACDELAAGGVVVVAAAGNGGHRMERLPDGTELVGYLAISITDPGNAEGVITVGSAHREKPHQYGVSYFSGRGPTGDGRRKPDLVAPGERIVSTVPGASSAPRDGTSQAAPHVSGAAALLMGRHSELIGRPARIKQILCDTATDLGRDRYFQGAGMVDVLRALQSI